MEKFPNTKAIGIYTFPSLRTAGFSPPGFGGKSESMFGWINTMKWKMFEHVSFNMYNNEINQLRASIDLPPIKVSYDQMIQSIFHKRMTTITIFSKYLLPRPSDWQENDHMVGPILEERHDHFEPSASILDFLNKWKSENIIYVGMGSMMSVIFQVEEQIQFLNNIQLALENSNCKAVISLVGFEQTHIDNLSNTENVFYLKESVPHSWLFLNMSAAIHHGGAGTTHASLRYGLPTLILPFGADQPFNGDRIFINKLGPRYILIRETNVKNLSKAIHDLMVDNYKMYVMNAKRISELIKNEDGLGHCVQLIEAELAT
ncbi:unnamed protein product [Rotaria sp. Silwood2]|nr:unnamed protein product [Rotaria sp. Silwood2]CAF3987174.1 unnamed protein product [Rotaria sp. Silwood2]